MENEKIVIQTEKSSTIVRDRLLVRVLGQTAYEESIADKWTDRRIPYAEDMFERYLNHERMLKEKSREVLSVSPREYQDSSIWNRALNLPTRLTSKYIKDDCLVEHSWAKVWVDEFVRLLFVAGEPKKVDKILERVNELPESFFQKEYCFHIEKEIDLRKIDSVCKFIDENG